MHTYLRALLHFALRPDIGSYPFLGETQDFERLVVWVPGGHGVGGWAYRDKTPSHLLDMKFGSSIQIFTRQQAVAPFRAVLHPNLPGAGVF